MGRDGRHRLDRWIGSARRRPAACQAAVGAQEPFGAATAICNRKSREAENEIQSIFAVGLTDVQQRGETSIEYNYRTSELAMVQTSYPADVVKFAAMCSSDASSFLRERPGMSAFGLEDGVVHHTYSTYARGLDGLWGMCQWLDRAPLGRNEQGAWWKRHDEYADAREDCCRAG